MLLFQKGPEKSLALLSAQNCNSTLVEAAWVFLCSDFKVHSEDKVRPREVQVDRQGYL